MAIGLQMTIPRASLPPGVIDKKAPQHKATGLDGVTDSGGR
jgi:hypothetical protein